MPRQSTDTCASCAKFDLYAAAKNGGAGPCAGYERPTTMNHPACVLYVEAVDRRARRDLAEQLRAQPQPQGEKP
jgi:hypothetical protein